MNETIYLENNNSVFVYPLAIIFLVVPSLKSKQQNKAINIMLINPNSFDKNAVICGNTFKGSISAELKEPIAVKIGTINKVNPKHT